jgi:dipeptidyl aminopeptidase/acylaminoacyl peptidase
MAGGRQVIPLNRRVPDVLTPERLVYELRSAGDPQVSPDGTRLLYVLGEVDRAADRSTSHIWTCRIDGSEPRRLTWAGTRNSEPRWSPDGRWVGFSSDRVSKHGIFVLPAEAPGEPREITRHAQSISGLAWSPDGRSIAYTTSFDPANPDETPPADGAAPRVRVTRRLDYKQDNRGYLADVRSQVFVVDVETGQRRMLTRDAVDHNYPCWSPGGEWVSAKVSTHNGLYSRLALIPLTGGEPRFIGPHGGMVAAWGWSPDGRRIVFAGDTHAGGPQTDFFLYEVDSDATRPLTTDLACLPDAGFPTIFPPSQLAWLDDRQVLFHGVRGGASGVYVLDVDSGDVLLERGSRALNVGFSVDRGRQIVAQGYSALDRTGDVVVYDRSSGDTRVVTTVNPDLRLAEWERFDVNRGSQCIEAWLLKPPNFDPSRRYPVVLDVHGGPHGYYGFGFNAVQQAIAAAGFLVVYSNPRGSGSYGRAFSDLVRLDWGGEDYLDLMAVVDEVLERPYADPERTGIWGYSYGGYMTAWVIGQTDRFKAAVSGAPCFDLTSMFGTSDISHVWGPIEWGGPPHTSPEWYAAHSPSSFAHRARTPTLIMQGEADDRCPIGQGEQMFVALQQAGCEVEFARYPGGSHLMLRVGPPSHRVDFISRVVGWFQEHLG